MSRRLSLLVGIFVVALAMSSVDASSAGGVSWRPRQFPRFLRIVVEVRSYCFPFHLPDCCSTAFGWWQGFSWFTFGFPFHNPRILLYITTLVGTLLCLCPACPCRIVIRSLLIEEPLVVGSYMGDGHMEMRYTETRGVWCFVDQRV